MNSRLVAAVRTVPLWVAASATVAAAGIELVAPDKAFPSWSDTAIHTASKLGILLIALIGSMIIDRRMPSLSSMGIAGSDVTPDERTIRRPVARRWTHVALLAVMFVSALGLEVGGEDEIGAAGAAVLAGVVFIRWPVSVISQQVLFFGWLQPRLRRWSLPIVVGLYTAYHLPQDSSLLYIAPLGVVFAALRWQTGSIRAGTAAHYLVNVVVLVVAAG